MMEEVCISETSVHSYHTTRSYIPEDLFEGSILPFALMDEENHENLNQDSRSQGRDTNPGPCEYEAEVL
jgi:hypothetical protein